jgi:hypothetical protein
MYAGALIKKPKDAPVVPQVIKKKVTKTSEGTVSCGSSDDGDNTIIIKAGALRNLEFEKNSDISLSEDEAAEPEEVKVQKQNSVIKTEHTAPDAPKR